MAEEELEDEGPEEASQERKEEKKPKSGVSSFFERNKRIPKSSYHVYLYAALVVDVLFFWAPVVGTIFILWCRGLWWLNGYYTDKMSTVTLSNAIVELIPGVSFFPSATVFIVIANLINVANTEPIPGETRGRVRTGAIQSLAYRFARRRFGMGKAGKEPWPELSRDKRTGKKDSREEKSAGRGTGGPLQNIDGVAGVSGRLPISSTPRSRSERRPGGSLASGAAEGTRGKDIPIESSGAGSGSLRQGSVLPRQGAFGQLARAGDTTAVPIRREAALSGSASSVKTPQSISGFQGGLDARTRLPEAQKEAGRGNKPTASQEKGLRVAPQASEAVRGAKKEQGSVSTPENMSVPEDGTSVRPYRVDGIEPQEKVRAPERPSGVPASVRGARRDAGPTPLSSEIPRQATSNNPRGAAAMVDGVVSRSSGGLQARESSGSRTGYQIPVGGREEVRRTPGPEPRGIVPIKRDTENTRVPPSQETLREERPSPGAGRPVSIPKRGPLGARPQPVSEGRVPQAMRQVPEEQGRASLPGTRPPTGEALPFSGKGRADEGVGSGTGLTPEEMLIAREILETQDLSPEERQQLRKIIIRARLTIEDIRAIRTIIRAHEWKPVSGGVPAPLRFSVTKTAERTETLPSVERLGDEMRPFA